MPAGIFTIGHSARSIEDFLALLTQYGVTNVVDVRKLAGSRKFPQFNADALEASLSTAGISLHHAEALTGRRPVSRSVDFAVNAWWTNRSFHNYADHALGDDFLQALQRLQARAAGQKTAIMCAEAVWWRCHRRIIADHLLARGAEVFHIIDGHPAKPAELSPGAVIDQQSRITYPAA
ncbi:MULTISPECIES: DUF488 family protein [Micrococcaceae]|uniref:DUF488 domain-containing protein n=1 Tax=Micrococcaceae TaxID=1268 RepID=UPI00105F2465|nr:DUF488 domain-containing protein [Arthrobacter sp. JUb115]TDU27308.1 uncharacterized protein DUF488 [Arthrobacter sp. JUb115]